MTYCIALQGRESLAIQHIPSIVVRNKQLGRELCGIVSNDVQTFSTLSVHAGGRRVTAHNFPYFHSLSLVATSPCPNPASRIS